MAAAKATNAPKRPYIKVATDKKSGMVQVKLLGNPTGTILLGEAKTEKTALKRASQTVDKISALMDDVLVQKEPT